MATVTFSVLGANNQTLTATAGDDVITVTDMGVGAGATANVINGGAGDDTVIFKGTLGATGAGTDYTAVSNGFSSDGGGTEDTATASGVENFQFSNGTVTFGASVNPELLMVTALEQASVGSSWNVGSLLTYNGLAATAVGAPVGWALDTVDGSSLTAGNTLTILDGTTVLGTVSLTGTTLSFTADNAFQTALNVGENADVSFDVVMENAAGDTFTETLTAVVTGTVSEGNDTLISAAGVAEDFTTGQDGDLLGGDDYAVGNDGADSIFGGDGNDTIYAGATDDAADHLVGGKGDDLLAGGADADILIGDNYDDTAVSGAMTVVADEGANEIFGGAGDDLIAIGGYTGAGAITNSATIAANADGATGGEAFGGDGNDFILGTATGHDLVGMGDGNDSVTLGAGNDTVYAGADDTGTDTVTITAGNNTVYTGAGADIITTSTAAAGNDLIGAGAGNDNIDAGAGNNTVYGGDGDDIIASGAGNGDIYGGAGGDTITITGAGDNDVYGGAGSDTINLSAGAGADVIVFAEGFGKDTITNFTTGTDTIDLTALGLTGFDDLVVSETAGGGVTIYLDADNTITYNGAFDADDFLF